MDNKDIDKSVKILIGQSILILTCSFVFIMAVSIFVEYMVLAKMILLSILFIILISILACFYTNLNNHNDED